MKEFLRITDLFQSHFKESITVLGEILDRSQSVEKLPSQHNI